MTDYIQCNKCNNSTYKIEAYEDILTKGFIFLCYSCKKEWDKIADNSKRMGTMQERKTYAIELKKFIKKRC